MSATIGDRGPLRSVKSDKRIVGRVRGEDGLVAVTWILELDCGHAVTYHARSAFPQRPVKARCPKCAAGKDDVSNG